MADTECALFKAAWGVVEAEEDLTSVNVLEVERGGMGLALEVEVASVEGLAPASDAAVSEAGSV